MFKNPLPFLLLSAVGLSLASLFFSSSKSASDVSSKLPGSPVVELEGATAEWDSTPAIVPDAGTIEEDSSEGVPPWSRIGLQKAKDEGIPIFTIADRTPYEVQVILFASLEGSGSGRFTASVDPSGRFEIDLPEGDYYVMPGAGPFEDLSFVQNYPILEVGGQVSTIMWKPPRKRSKLAINCDHPMADPSLCQK